MIDWSALDGGFRQRFLSHEELTRQLHAWAEAMPGVARLESLAKSEGGRDVWLLTIGRDPDRRRPAAWIDGNIHASELAGSSVCLAIAEDLLRAHAGDPLVDLPPHLRELLLDDVLFYILPRMCPDGAERVLTRRHFVRSNPRDHRPGHYGPYWRHEDVDGDGISLLMRVKDPTGDFCESPDMPGLMLPRKIEDAGPFYRIYPEGFIERWDGFTLPRPSFMSDTETDVNRNFPSDWRPEPDQVGAGPYPGSEPESRAIVAFAADHPNIFIWLCMHTYGGVYIRPLNDKPDAKMDPFDAAVFRQIEEWGDAIAGYPTVSGFTEFTYEPDKPLHGDLSNFGYVERGAIGFVCELWDFFKQVGFDVKRPFIKNYEDRTKRDDILKIAAWDREHNQGRIIGSWRAFEHPQLGPVELGGYDPLIGVWNPPYERLGEVCIAQSRFFLRIAALAPKILISSVKVEPLENDLHRIEIVVENHGYLPSFILGSAKHRNFSDPMRARISLDKDLELVSGDAEIALGHMMGWGGNDRSTTPMLARSTVEHSRRRLVWVVRGRGQATATVSNARVGEVTKAIAVP
ncbi:MAG: peptidase M14 [Polyangiaceae bacterium]|nr:peptidase M14 [Polyangiaceae bacterium]